MYNNITYIACAIDKKKKNTYIYINTILKNTRAVHNLPQAFKVNVSKSPPKNRFLQQCALSAPAELLCADARENDSNKDEHNIIDTYV